ncbi:hypothetical protein KOR34_44620 [Posidoniimonas corsicana]|uniref:Lipoprotein n=1 Tax=Posidoniimonas corsicana TaxID=1938618 RepID=A0A5C5UY45_9BACT|nr:hypothetical protein [Posidoniimonas corsicana]TWT31088.1 hypothetical protein KOR34_44620 [Posidoniimonas corsicana]
MPKYLLATALTVTFLGACAVSDASAGWFHRHSQRSNYYYRSATPTYRSVPTPAVRVYRSTYSPSFFRDQDGYGES